MQVFSRMPNAEGRHRVSAEIPFPVRRMLFGRKIFRILLYGGVLLFFRSSI